MPVTVLNTGTFNQGGTSPAAGLASATAAAHGASTTAGGALIGSTVGPGAFTGTLNPTTFAQAAADYDMIVGRTMAESLSKAYSSTAGLSPDYTGMKNQNAANPGMKWLMAFIPDHANTTTDRTTLAASIAQMQADGFDFKVTLAQEANIGGKFASAADYQAYVAFYHPVLVSAGVEFVYNPALTSAPASAPAYYPGDQYVDMFLCDFYCSGYDAGSRLDDCAALADGHTTGSSSGPGVNGTGSPAPVPFGLGEWGCGPTTPTGTQFTTYTNYLASFFGARDNTGVWIIWFNAIDTYQLNNTIDEVSDADFSATSGFSRIGGVQTVFDALT
jgi:hypothetical protein